MQQEVDDFMAFCRIERRLAPLTCKAYERDVKACEAFLRSRGIEAVGDVKPPDLRALLVDEASHRPAVSSQSRGPLVGQSVCARGERRAARRSGDHRRKRLIRA